MKSSVTAPTSRTGLALLDLVITLMILGILATAAVPRFADALCRFRTEAAAKRIAADLQFARREARTRGADVAVKFDLTLQSYELPGVPDPDHPLRDYKVELAKTGYPVKLISADFGGSGDLRFDIYGRPVAGGSIVVASGAATRSIEVADQGAVTLP